jgi:pyrroline-5-carboxylate reductase
MTAPGAGQQLLLIGCGNMGRAILDGWLASGRIAPDAVVVLDPAAPALPPGVLGCSALGQVPAGGIDIVVLAVKPQLVGQVAGELAGSQLAGRRPLLLSILAGVPLARLAKLFPGMTPVRFMGNLAAAFGRSPVAACAGSALDPARTALVDRVLAPLGPVEWLDDEDQLHAVTALAGSGPGFVYRFLDALAQGGAAIGLPPPAAARMALATVAGAAELAARSDEDFAALAARGSSKGGTTEAGLAVLDAGDGLRRLVAATLEAARTRRRELAGES